MVTKIKNTIQRVSMLLAAANFSDDEILEIRDHFATNFNPLVEQVRNYRIKKLDGTDASLAVDMRAPVQPTSEPVDTSTAKQLERFLIQDAGLSKIEAAQLLTYALHRRRPKVWIPPFNSKDGFSRWVKQISTLFPLGELLHAAVTVRNSRVHQKGDDWIESNESS